MMKNGLVILADKHQDMLEGIRGLLETVFDTVVMVADRDALFETAQRLEPDLAIVDLSLPIASEINIVRQFKERHPDLKCIVLSVHDDEEVIEQVLSSGAVGFVLKRTAGADLIPAVVEVLEGRTFVSAGEAVRTRR
ncbi:MAG: response regulator transcription factor [Desulfobacteraceae bacterium]|jgi:DNA-binding NarL/FixJ family response regulator